MSIIELAQDTPVAFIVYVPPEELLVADPMKVEKTVRNLESSVQDNMVAFTESPHNIFISDERLSPKERQLREANLQALQQGFFELLVLAGSSISEYIRAIVYFACKSDIDISLYSDEDTLLSQYLAMQQGGRMRDCNQ